MTDLWDKFWKDNHGKVVVYQRPNLPLLGWLVLTILSLFFNGGAATVFWWGAEVVLAAWALLEIFKGVNYLRRILGIVILLMVIASIFKVGY